MRAHLLWLSNMTYQNTKTGAVINTVCEIKGANWVAIKPSNEALETKPTVKKKTKKVIENE